MYFLRFRRCQRQVQQKSHFSKYSPKSAAKGRHLRPWWSSWSNSTRNAIILKGILHDHFLSWLDRLIKQTKSYFIFRYGVDCLCEIIFLATKPQHRQQGLAKLLVKTAIDLAKKFREGPIAPLTVADLGPNYAFMKPRKVVTKPPLLCTALWSAVGSKRCGAIYGFDVLEVFSFGDLIYDGKPCSDRIGAVTTCEGAALRIWNVKLNLFFNCFMIGI